MMGSNEIDFRIFYEKIKEDRVKLVDSIEADLQRVREVDELLERIARHHGFEHNGNGHVPTPEVQAPQKAAKIATIKAKDGTEERKYIVIDGKKKLTPRTIRIRDGYSIDKDTGYVRHTALRAGIDALRRLGAGSTLDEICKEIARVGGEVDRNKLRTSLRRNGNQGVAAVYAEKTDNPGIARYFLWEWRPGTKQGKAAIQILRLQKVGDKLVPPKYDKNGLPLVKAKPVTEETKASAFSRLSAEKSTEPMVELPPVKVEERAKAPSGNEPPYLDPSWDDARIWNAMSSPQRNYMVNSASNGQPRIRPLKFALEPEWAAKVHRGEITADE